MKLDKIKFGRLISYLTEQFGGRRLTEVQIGSIDELIDIELPDATPINVDRLHVLMSLMYQGERKIEAIKQHRMMTGYGLKESKDIVEKYWPQMTASDLKDRMNKHLEDHTLHPDSEAIIRSFIAKF